MCVCARVHMCTIDNKAICQIKRYILRTENHQVQSSYSSKVVKFPIHLTTPWNKALKTLQVSQPLKKFPPFYETWRLIYNVQISQSLVPIIIVFKSACHCFPSCPAMPRTSQCRIPELCSYFSLPPCVQHAPIHILVCFTDITRWLTTHFKVLQK